MALDPSSRQVAIVILAAASCLINNILISSCACPCNRFNRFDNGAKVNNTLEDCASKLKDCTCKTAIFILGTLYMNFFIFAMISGSAMSLPIKQEDDVHKDTAAVATSSLAAKNGSITTLNTLLEVE